VSPKPGPKAPRQTAAEARAEAQARAAAGKAARDAAIAERFDGGIPGSGILLATKLTTAVWVVVTVAVAIVDTRGLRIALAYFDSALFVVGCGVFLRALYEGAQRSREADLTMGGWWFLSGSAPTFVRVTLSGAVAVQTVVGLATAAIRIETTLAFGILVPTLGLAFCGLWGARHGMFPPRKFAQEQVAIPRRRKR
jgi:hypothetical protein